MKVLCKLSTTNELSITDMVTNKTISFQYNRIAYDFLQNFTRAERYTLQLGRTVIAVVSNKYDAMINRGKSDTN